MPPPSSLDGEARAELLCYLVVGQLVARAHTLEWLRADHLVESTRVWLAGNGTDTDWTERVYLRALSEQIALDFCGTVTLRRLGVARQASYGWLAARLSIANRALNLCGL